MPSRHPVICGIGLSDYPVVPHLNSVQHHTLVARRAIADCRTALCPGHGRPPEGVRMFGGLTGVDPEAVEIGMDVTAYARTYDDTQAMVFWEPA